MQKPDRRTPCIVLGLETQIALSVVRELGRAGIPVIGIAQSEHAIGLHSRYLVEAQVCGEPRSEHMLEVLSALAARFPGAPLLTVSEANMTWLTRHLDRLGSLRPMLPSAEALDTVLDKSRTLALARQIGIAVPETLEAGSLAQIEAAADTLSFPVVLKWKDPGQIAPALHAQGIALEKFEYANNKTELMAIARRYAPVGQWPLIQAYCPGVGFGQFFFMHHGEAIRRFQHIRIAEWPPEGGFSSVCESVPISRYAELQEKSIRLLQAIQWEGVAMVEYRLDPATGNAVLMEINGRFWGSFPLAVQCNAGFARLAYEALADDAPGDPGPLGSGRCRMMSTELKRLVRICLQPGKIADPTYVADPIGEVRRFVGDFFRRNVGYYVWSKDDPKPFWADVKNALARR